MVSHTRLLFTLTAVLASARAADAQEVREFPVMVRIRCKSELSGPKGLTKAQEAWTRDIKLAQSSCGESAMIKVADYHKVVGSLECSRKQDDEPFTYRFTVKLLSKGDEVHHASLRNLGLEERTGKAPLVVDSFAFLAPPETVEGVSFTRIDYSCSIETLAKHPAR